MRPCPALGGRRRCHLGSERPDLAGAGRKLRPPPARPLERRAGLERADRCHRARSKRPGGRDALEDGPAHRAGRRAPRAGPARRRGGGQRRRCRADRVCRSGWRPRPASSRERGRAPAAPSSCVWWLAGRSAGMVAMLLIAGSVILGLAMAARVLPSRWRRDAVSVHQYLALLSLGAIGAHGALLAADPWLKAGAKGILVPFAIGYRPLWTGLGIVGGYLAAILGLSFYARKRIGVKAWRRMHRFTVVVYVL